jgi:hypothetical protein
MLTLLPVFFLILTALAVFFLRRLVRGTGFAWLAGVIFSLVTWGGVLWVHWQVLPEVNLTPWRPFDLQSADRITFAWDDVSWTLGFALVSLLVCLLLTAPARLQHRSSPVTWSANLTITAIGLLAVLAASPMAAVLAWILLDIIELVLLLRLIGGEKISLQAVAAFCAKAGGTLVMLWAMVQAHAAGGALTYADVRASTGVFILIAAGFRLGVLPLYVPYSGDLPMQRGMSTTLRMTAQASSLAVLARLPGGLLSGFWMQALLIIAALAAFYGAAMWVTARNETDGRQYWSLSLAGFSVAAALHGDRLAVLTWGVVLIVSGGIISLYSARSRGLIFLPVLGLVGLVGLPFTPAAAGIAGLAAPPLHIVDVLFILSLALLSAGYLRLSLMPGDTLAELERWVLGVYPPGLILLAVSGWLIVILESPGGLSPGVWWASLVSLFLAAGLFWLLLAKAPAEEETQAGAIRFFKSAVSPVLNLSWLYRILWVFLVGLQRILALITRMLEGEGGVLWAMLLVVLLLTVLTGGGFIP